MERLAPEHPEAQFLVIAVREAHPGEITAQHTTATQKRQAARRLAIEEKHPPPRAGRRLGRRGPPRVRRRLESHICHRRPRHGHIAFRRAWNHPDEVAQTLDALANGLQPPKSESTQMPKLPSRAPTGLRLLERGGKQALLDFYRSAPPPIRALLQKSPAQAVRSTIGQEEQ